MDARPIQLSILDRFAGGEEPPRTRGESLARLKSAVRRDLEWLLNTRRPAGDLPEGSEALQRSVYWFGLPDFSAVSLSSPESRSDLLQGIQEAVNRFEPRLMQVRVTLVDEPSVESPQLRFVIDALLRLEPAPERVSFDTVMEISDGKYRVRGEAGDRRVA
jgi:type VI secretion system protein ImpF